MSKREARARKRVSKREVRAMKKRYVYERRRTTRGKMERREGEKGTHHTNNSPQRRRAHATTNAVAQRRRVHDGWNAISFME